MELEHPDITEALETGYPRRYEEPEEPDYDRLYEERRDEQWQD